MNPESKTIHRRILSKENPFVMMPKDALDDPNLSWQAKGILAYLLGKPDDWRPQRNDIINHGSDGECAVRSAMKELRDKHYARLSRVTAENGQMVCWLYEVADAPILPPEDWQKGSKKAKKANKKPDVENRHAGNGHVENPREENPPSSNNEASNKECSDTERTKKEGEQFVFSESKSNEASEAAVPCELPAEAVIWNEAGLPKVRKVGASRLKALKARRKEADWQDEFKEAIQRIKASNFLTGKNDRGWRADFDWITRDGSLTKVLEGKYDNRNGHKPNPEPNERQENLKVKVITYG